MIPIPLTILKNTIQYYELDKSSRYEGTFKPPITIKNVLINYSYTVKKTNPGNQEQSKQGTMYIDCVNSYPLVEMKYGDKIVSDDGKEFFVKLVKPVQFYSLHHYEVELM